MHKTERVLPTPTAPHLPPLPAGAERGQFQGVSSWGHCETQPENRVSSPGGPGSCGHGSVCCGWQVPQTPRHGQGWSGPLSDPPFPPRFILLLPDPRQALELTQLDCCHSSLEPWPRWPLFPLSKMAVWGALQIAVKRREVKSKGEKEKYKHLNAEFQIARRDKKAFFSDQCKEIEENNRMGRPYK